MAKRYNKEVEKTQRFIAKNEEKKKSVKQLIFSIGTLTVTTAAAIGVVVIISAAKNNQI